MAQLKLYELMECTRSLFAPALLSQSEETASALFSKIESLGEQQSIIRYFISGSNPAFDSNASNNVSADPPAELLGLPYLGAGILREQLERLYWTTVAGLEAETHRTRLPSLPDCLRPNLEIVTVDGSVICHDWVLVARWRFVRNMFLFAGEETESRRVSLEDVGITTAALHYILYFMYTDRLDLLNNQSLCLSILKWCHELYLSDFDDQPFPGSERLIIHCTKPFAQHITLENAVPIYRAAIEGGSVEHEKRALTFIARKLRDMMESDRRCAELRTLDTEVLSSIMFEHFGKSFKPEEAEGVKPKGDRE